MLTADAIIAALPELSDADLNLLLEAARQERERRQKEKQAEASLTEVLDDLTEGLMTAMERLASIDPTDPETLTRDLVRGMLVGTGCPFPVLAVAGFKNTSRCRCRWCGEADKASGWPEILGVKVWDWPWQPVEPVKYPGREMYAKGFVISYAPVQKAGMPVVIHLYAGVWPCRCSEEHPRSYPIYLQVDGEEVQEISWAKYMRMCSRAAQELREVREAQEKSAADPQRRRR